MTVAAGWRGETHELDEKSRRAAPGAFARLSAGLTHYEAAGPERQRAVVLIHGFSVPYFIWDPTFQFLVGAGFHAIRYDLFGRGYSDRPDTSYGMPLYLDQLEQLLDRLKVERADLIALSMGGPIAAAFAVTHPPRVGRIVLIDPSGSKPIQLGLLRRLLTIRGVGEAVFRYAGTEYMLNMAAADFFDPASVDLFRERYRAQMELRGFRRALLSSVRCNMLGSFEGVYVRLGQLGKPILIIWGEEDRTVPFEHSRRLRELLPGAEFRSVAHCGHIPHYEQPEVVNACLLGFLN